MIAFATYTDLRKLGREERALNFSKAAHTVEGKTVFLSHSSLDDDLVAGAVLILENHGGRVYVDKKDPHLPKDNFTEVANHLRSVIKACKKTVLLVTKNSKDSKWIPWELGLGDGMKGDPNVALFPSADSYLEHQWAEQEYLGLYKRIVYADMKGESGMHWVVLDHRNNVGEKLETWLKA